MSSSVSVFGPQPRRIRISDVHGHRRPDPYVRPLTSKRTFLPCPDPFPKFLDPDIFQGENLTITDRKDTWPSTKKTFFLRVRQRLPDKEASVVLAPLIGPPRTLSPNPWRSVDVLKSSASPRPFWASVVTLIRSPGSQGSPLPPSSQASTLAKWTEASITNTRPTEEHRKLMSQAQKGHLKRYLSRFLDASGKLASLRGQAQRHPALIVLRCRPCLPPWPGSLDVGPRQTWRFNLKIPSKNYISQKTVAQPFWSPTSSVSCQLTSVDLSGSCLRRSGISTVEYKI